MNKDSLPVNTGSKEQYSQRREANYKSLTSVLVTAQRDLVGHRIGKRKPNKSQQSYLVKVRVQSKSRPRQSEFVGPSTRHQRTMQMERSDETCRSFLMSLWVSTTQCMHVNKLPSSGKELLERSRPAISGCHTGMLICCVELTRILRPPDIRGIRKEDTEEYTTSVVG